MIMKCGHEGITSALDVHEQLASFSSQLTQEPSVTCGFSTTSRRRIEGLEAKLHTFLLWHYTGMSGKKVKLSHYTPWRRLGGEEV
jgi:hypothetical protein